MSVSKILVANRGEIAVRILRTCAELDLPAAAVYSEVDAAAMHVRIADEAICLGAAGYLDIAAIVQAALDCGAEAVHPGYGFLAENAQFAQAVTDAGLTFIGPPAAAIAAMGSKVAARSIATAAGVPVVPGTDTPVETAGEVMAFGREHGYPIAIKASFGGGGRGMRIVTSEQEAGEALQAAQREALAGFGRADVYIERYLARARHIEVQILADTHGEVCWLGDRDCSVQRRHQKLIEEAPAPGLPDELRQAMGEAAVRLAQQVSYVGAGTVEYLVEDGRFYFLEMNTRIQVEHPVTEEVLGIDLVAEQLRVAAGSALRWTTSGPAPRGHAIECRLNAEAVAGGAFVPTPGDIHRLGVPYRPGLRFDTGYESGDEVLAHYDSMLGKLVAWAPDRHTAITRLRLALGELTVEGVPTTAEAARLVLEHPDFVAAGVTTKWLETQVEFPAATMASPGDEYRADGDGHVNGDGGLEEQLWVAGRRYVLPSARAGVAPTPAGRPDRPARRASRPGRARPPARGGGGQPASGTVLSPMQGTVIAVKVAEGELVTAGQVLFVVEAMKMENPVAATVDGTVTALRVVVGETVSANGVLATVEPTGDADAR